MTQFSKKVLDKANDHRTTKSSGNIFADLGRPNPEERLLKADLALHIHRLIREKGWTQTQAAKIVGIGQPHLSKILRGHLSGYSVERLLTIINHLGRGVEVRISSQDMAQAATTVCVSDT